MMNVQSGHKRVKVTLKLALLDAVAVALSVTLPGSPIRAKVSTALLVEYHAVNSSTNSKG